MLLFAMMLAAAAPAETVLSDDDTRQMAMVAQGRQAEAVGRAGMMKTKELEPALRQALTDRTRAVLVQGYGIYVVYTAADGRLYAWFPGRPDVVGGTWGVQKISKKTSVACQRFDRPSAPRTGAYLPTECVPVERTLGDLDSLQSWPGDPFGLASGRVPFVKQAMGLPSL